MLRSRMLALGLALTEASCGFISARRPPELSPDLREVEVSFPWLGNSGVSLAGLRADGGGAVLTGDAGGLVPATADCSANVAIRRGEDVAWVARCTSAVDGAVRPPVGVACLFLPGSRNDAPLSLALASPMHAPLRGVFFTKRGAWRIEGTRRLRVGLAAPDTVGYLVRGPDHDRPRAFIDHGAPRPVVYVEPDVTPDELAELAPLMLVFVTIRDARYLFRSDNVPLRTDPQARLLPLPPPLSQGPTDHERHLQALVDMKELDAARALYARILQGRVR